MVAPVPVKSLVLSKSGALAFDISKMEMKSSTSAGDVVTFSSLCGVVMNRGSNARGVSFKGDCLAKYRLSIFIFCINYFISGSILVLCE